MKEEEREARQAAREEAARLAKEEEEKRKQEEYDKWKDMFSVDDAGEEVGGEAEDEGLLAKFVAYIKRQKVAILAPQHRQKGRPSSLPPHRQTDRHTSPAAPVQVPSPGGSHGPGRA